VLLPCGHSATAGGGGLSARPILLARTALVVLCYDPIGQGERYQLLDIVRKPAVASQYVGAHTVVGTGAAARRQEHRDLTHLDGIRSLDYLASGPEVDPKRLGCTGNSGGGTLTAYLMALG